MKPLLITAMIAAMALLSAIPAKAQPSGKRVAYCQPKPLCPYGQTSVCQLFGETADDCRCQRWSRCFGQVRAPSTQSRSAPRGVPRPIPQRIAPPPKKPVIPPRLELPSTR